MATVAPGNNTGLYNAGTEVPPVVFVEQIIAGNNITVDPVDGTGIVTVSLSTGGNVSFGNITVTGTATIATGNITTANISTITVANATIGNTYTTVLSTGSNAIAGTITGDWTLTAGSTLNATYADLAERFWADAEYDAGTVVELGGAAEVTAVRSDASDNVFGVISASAGMIMNGAAGPDSTHPKIAMTGRVPVKVVGAVRKGNRLISAGDGMARAALPHEITDLNTIGRALEDKLTTGTGLVLAAVSART